MQSFLYLVAALLAFGLGIAHSVLGERRIFIPLSRRGDAPKLVGGTEFRARALRAVWHLATFAWWTAAAFFLAMASARLTPGLASSILGVFFLVTCLVSGVISRGRHFSWPVFLAIS